MWILLSCWMLLCLEVYLVQKLGLLHSWYNLSYPDSVVKCFQCNCGTLDWKNHASYYWKPFCECFHMIISYFVLTIKSYKPKTWEWECKFLVFIYFSVIVCCPLLFTSVLTGMTCHSGWWVRGGLYCCKALISFNGQKHYLLWWNWQWFCKLVSFPNPLIFYLQSFCLCFSHLSDGSVWIYSTVLLI